MVPTRGLRSSTVISTISSAQRDIDAAVRPASADAPGEQ